MAATTACQTKQTPTFTTLPFEFRNQVYEYCLIHDEEMNPFPPDWERAEIERSNGRPAKRILCTQCSGPCRRTSTGKRGLQHHAHHWPCIALLGVSKGIRREASRILLSKNTWRISIPADQHAIDDLDHDQHNWGGYYRYYYSRRSDRFRHARLVFDQRDLDQCNILDMHRQLVPSSAGDVQNLVILHRRYSRLLQRNWCIKAVFALQMERIKTIIFDYTNVFCSFGCCRLPMLSMLCKSLSTFMLPSDTEGQGGKFGGVRMSGSTNPEVRKYTAPRVVTIVGLLSDAEKDVFREKWPMELVFKDRWEASKSPEICQSIDSVQ